MTASIRLRRWQKSALDRLAAAGGPDFLAVATPGAGKTTFALTALRQRLAERPAGRVVVVTPTAHLKAQWSLAAEGFGIHLDPAWVPADGPPPAEVHGIVTTYQQVASSAAAVAPLAAGGLVVLDEIHHAGDERAWGDAVRAAFGEARLRLSLSGTPFRSDTRAIPFVRYEADGGNEAVPDVEYGYGDALDERVVRPVWFPALNGRMEWQSADGMLHEATFDDPLDRERSAQRLRTALALEGEWLPAVLRQAHERLTVLRREAPDAAGLVIAMDQDHARGIGAVLRDRFAVRAEVVTSDDPMASLRIEQFAGSLDPWIVAVRMVSEGVDIPRLRVGVFATTTTTELFFRQAVGRLVRWTAGPAQRAYFFIPDDLRLRALAHGIAEVRRHSLRRRQAEQREPDVREVQAEEARAARDTAGEQLSLFAALSAVPVGEVRQAAAVPGGWDDWDVWVDEPPGDGPVGGVGSTPVGDELVVQLGPLPGPSGRRAPGAHLGRRGPGGGPACTESPVALRRRLRDRNAAAARELARRTGMDHAQVNAELNRRAGIQRVATATLDQLEHRLALAERWLTSA